MSIRFPTLPLFLVLLFLFSPVAAEPPLEIIELKARSAEELVPILRPLAGERASVAGRGRHLFIRTTPERLEELRSVIDRLDRPPRQLLISVHQGRLTDAVRRQLGVHGRLQAPEVRVIRSRTRDKLDATQRIRVLEGRPAFIATGKSHPIPYHDEWAGPGGRHRTEGTVYRDTATGFYAVPRLNGERVTLDIHPFMARRGNIANGFEMQQAATTLSGRLGEWIPIGGVDLDDTRDGRGITRRHTTLNRDESQILLRVDPVE